MKRVWYLLLALTALIFIGALLGQARGTHPNPSLKQGGGMSAESS
jgi:hypothetical protein